MKKSVQYRAARVTCRIEKPPKAMKAMKAVKAMTVMKKMLKAMKSMKARAVMKNIMDLMPEKEAVEAENARLKLSLAKAHGKKQFEAWMLPKF